MSEDNTYRILDLIDGMLDSIAVIQTRTVQIESYSLCFHQYLGVIL